MVMKRKSWSRFGVSDIIANILILGITVVLFSGIIMFVSSMPTPSSNTYGDFSAKVEYKTGEYVNITIKHLGGEPLKDWNTKLYISTGAGTLVANISDSKPTIGTSWNLGATWTYNTTNETVIYVTAQSKLDVMIVDSTKNIIIWTGKLLGGMKQPSP
jgi:FlaG/FlaF family flagellin (archaellin)